MFFAYEASAAVSKAFTSNRVPEGLETCVPLPCPADRRHFVLRMKDSRDELAEAWTALRDDPGFRTELDGLLRHFVGRPTPNIAPSWNVAPTDPLPIVRYDAKTGERSLEVMRWGLVPFWAKDIKVGFSNINAKAEGIEGKPAFREAFQRRRCLVPVDNFYE